MSRSAHWPRRATSARRGRWSVPLGIAFLLASASGASAQGPSLTAPDSTWLVQDSVARACLDTLSDGSARPVTVYQIATASDTSRTVLDEIALISQHIGERVRAALGNGRDAVSAVDTLVAWRRLAGRVPIQLVVHREAATTWSIDSGADPAKAKLVTLYSSVLRTMPGDELEMVWPEHLASDSVTVRLELSSTEVSNRPLPRPGYPMVSVFRTRGVAFRPAVARPNNPTPVYPMDAVQHAVSAQVIMGIVVRLGGHADGAVRSVVISSRGSISSGARAHFAQEFTSVVEGVVKRMRFEPARVGGCAVPQQADFPFSFFRG
ncbi:MAG TPA: hypothetical protein VL157_04150 [Gemmatimonadaceae bacterium]|nr:hypothetical protein [Gemmatimonadaceae bacterium]